LGEVADHFAKRGVFSAHLGQIGQTKVLEPKDVGVQSCLQQDAEGETLIVRG
jgi:hypothetical protein